MSLPSAIAELIDESYALERSGDASTALRRAQEALDQAQASGEAEWIATVLNRIAGAQFRLGHYPDARSQAQEALNLAPPQSPARAEALLILGNCAAETDSLADAEALYQHAADLSREMGHTVVRMRALHGMGQGVYMPRGQFDLALAAENEACRIASELNLSDWLCFPLTTIAWVYQITGRYQRAHETLQELGRVAAIGGPGSLHQGYHHYLSANLALDEVAAEQARILYTQACSIAESIGEPGLNIDARLGLGRYHRAVGNAASARDWASDALSLADHVGYRHEQGKALIERSRAAWLCDDLAAAEADLRAALEVLIPLQANYDLARAYLLLAALLHAQERAEADAVWLEAVSRIVSGGYAFLLEQERALAFPLLASFLNSDDLNVVTVSETLLSRLECVPPPPLRIVTLGRFEVWQNAKQVNRRALGQRRAGELLRLLLVSPGRMLARDAIIEALWPGKSPAAMQTPFHQATSALRHALEPDLPDKFPSRYLEVEGGQVTLHLPPGSWVDWEAFEQNVREEKWEEALALYSGELFPSDRYADWAAERREWTTQCFLRAGLGAARQRLEGGQAEAALEACRRMLAIEPWYEETVLIGMRACLALNDRTGALRLYCNLERILREDLGAAPQPELQQFYDKLL